MTRVLVRRFAVLTRLARLRRGGAEPLWPPVVAVLAILLLQLTLAEQLTVGPNWLVPLLEVGLLVPFSLAALRHRARETAPSRLFNVALIALINLFNLFSLLLLLQALLRGGAADGVTLLENALKLWVTNVIGFALWYWELDRGGPWRRQRRVPRQPDFLFPQMNLAGAAAWTPDFADYLFVSFTNAAAFSPTDTLPLTGRSKMLMMTQAFISLVTVALVASRAVNILK